MPVIHIFYCSGVDIRRLDDPGQNIVGEIMLYQKPFTQAAGNDDLYTDGESPG